MLPAKTKKPLFSIQWYLPSLSDELLIYMQGLLEECAGRRGEGEGEGMKYIIRKHDDRDVPVEAEPHCTYWTRRAENRGLKNISILEFGGMPQAVSQFYHPPTVYRLAPTPFTQLLSPLIYCLPSPSIQFYL